MTLHDELGLLADTAPRPTIDHTLWDQGRALRRRDRLVASAVALALVVIVGGLASLVLGPPRAVSPTGDTVPEGAIPSVIRDVPADADLPVEKDLAIGRASVAFISGVTNLPVVVSASDGRYHHLDLSPPLALALSPDGLRLAWASSTRLHVADLETGDVLDFPHNNGRGARVSSLYWQEDSINLTWRGRDETGGTSGLLDITGPSEGNGQGHLEWRGVRSPNPEYIVAMPSDGRVADAPFLQLGRGTGGSSLTKSIDRALPADLYPDGASVRPLGWAADDLVLAEVDAPAGSYVEGPHLALFTSPDRPESEWTYRIVMRDLPDVNVSVATDLIPDLDGTSSQQLTHDFGDPAQPGQRDVSWIIGLGVAGALCVLYGLRWLWRRRTGF